MKRGYKVRPYSLAWWAKLGAEVALLPLVITIWAAVIMLATS